MSKSLHNFITVRDLLDGNWSGDLESHPPQPPLGKGGSKNEGSEKSKAVEPMAVRLFVLMAQYRSQIDFTEEAIANARNGWNTLKEGIVFGDLHGSLLGWDLDKIKKLPLVDSEALQQFHSAMDDDFNTPNALAVLFELAKELRRERNIIVHGGNTEMPSEVLQQKWQTLVRLAEEVLGLTNRVRSSATIDIPAPSFSLEAEIISGLTDEDIEVMIQQRKDARKAKNFAEGDRIRNELKDRGITLIDQKDGTTIWHRG